MKKVTLLLFFVSLISCKKETTNHFSSKEEIIKEDPYIDLYGNWVGDFIATVHDTTNDFVYSNKINIIIKKIEHNKVFGQSIVAGNSRPLEGEFINHNYQFTLKEPGDNPYDGRFEFSIQDGILKGKWFSNDKNQHVTEREFELKKQEFKYNPKLMLPVEEEYVDYYNSKIQSETLEPQDSLESEETYSYETYRAASDIITKINASTTKLNEADLKNLKKLELEIIRNTIFARHGYTFKKKSYRQFFDPVDWYVPISNNVEKDLTSLEKENTKLLIRFEKYAEDNYDTFGR